MNPMIRAFVFPTIVLTLLILPVKLSSKQLMTLAFVLWLTGGLMLTALGLSRLLNPELALPMNTIAMTVATAMAVGFAKGKFVLGKTSKRNIERLMSLEGPQKPIHVYNLRSWIIIGLMVLISLSLTWFGAPEFWRGAVNIGVGFALIASSFSYLSVAQKKEEEPAV